MPVAVTPAKIALGLITLALIGSTFAAWAWVIYRLATRQRLLPDGPPRYVPWDGRAVLALLMAYIGLQIVVPALYVQLVLAPRPGEKAHGGPGDQLLVMILASVPFLAIGSAILARWTGANAANFGIELGRVPKEFLRGIVAWPILAPAVFGVNFLVLRILKVRVPHAVETLAGQNPGPMTWAMIFFAAVVVAPVTEEFLFRGVLLGWLNRVATGRKTADRMIVDDLPDTSQASINGDVSVDPPVAFEGFRLLMANLLVSFVFAALHGQVWPTPIPLFVLAMALGTIYQRTGSLIAPIALHMTFNGISTAMLYLITVAGGLDALKQGLP